MPYSRKKQYHHNLHIKKGSRLRNRTKDLDQIDTDLKTKAPALINQAVDFDTPGLAQHYCVHCAKYFINDRAMQDHFKTKRHKLRLKALEMDPYTVEESERAAGKGNFVQPKKRKMETQPTKEELASGSKVVKVEYLTETELAAAEAKKRKRQKTTDKDGDVKMG